MSNWAKQIIIDGCDVSGCECYSEHREGYCGWHIPCEGDICPYKLKWALQQLEAKEQECETLASQLDFEVQKKECLEQEYEELKKQFKLAEPLYQACNIKDKKIDKLKQTLQEIKKIIKQGIKIHDDIIVSKQILQKISEFYMEIEF